MRPPWAAPAAYLALLVVALGRTIGSATALTGADWTFLDYPFYRFSRDVFLAEGRLPFWNPVIFCGMPHLVSLNSHVLYPTELLSLPLNLPAFRFYGLDVLLHLWIAGCGFNLWQRRIGRAPDAAFAGGLCYMLGGHLLSLVAVGIPWLRCLAWLPWIFCCLEAGSAGGTLAWHAAAGALLALCVLTAGMQFTAFTLVVAAGWTAFTGTGTPRDRAARLGVLLAALAGLSAVVWIPALEYYANSVRARPELFQLKLSTQWILSPWDLLTLVVPELFGTAGNYHGPQLLFPTPDYEGLLPLALAAAGLAAVWRAQRRWIVLAGTALVLALGPATPIGLALSHLPVFAGFRGAVRWFMFVHLALCVTAVYGWEILRSAAAAGAVRRIAVACAGVTLACLVCAVLARPLSGLLARASFMRERLTHGTTSAMVEDAVRSGSMRAAAAGVVATAAAIALPAAPWLGWTDIAGDTLLNGFRTFRFGPEPDAEPDDPVAAAIRADAGALHLPVRVYTDEPPMLPNRRWQQRIEWVFAYHGLPLYRYIYLYLLAVSPPPQGNPLMLDALNVRYVVAARPTHVRWPRIAAVPTEPNPRAAVLRNPAPAAGARLAHGLIPCVTLEQVVDEIRRPDWTPDRVPTDSEIPADLLAVRPGTAGTVTVTRGRDELTARATLSASGWVILPDPWYPAWHAWVDGRRTRIFRAYGALRMVPVPAGVHTVRMAYDSWRFKAGLWLSLLSLTAGLWIAGVRAGRSDPA